MTCILEMEMVFFFCRSSGAAKPLEQILDEVAQRQSVPREAAEQRLVVFLLSHRWLRTTDAEYHPDSEAGPRVVEMLFGIRTKTERDS